MKIVFICISLASASDLLAWNKAGHEIIAAFAYEHLATKTRARIDELLAKHPDYPRWTQAPSAFSPGKTAFIRASIWADEIRTDIRFYTPGPRSRPTPDIPNLPAGANQRHEDWHYTNQPFSTDKTPQRPPPAVNILSKLKDFQRVDTFDIPSQIYALPWILHLIGDVHQPLHTVMLFREDLPNGDRGGNAIKLKSGESLHAYWDSRLGSSASDTFITKTVQLLGIRFPEQRNASTDPAVWVAESFEQTSFVYSFSGHGSAQDPAMISASYAVRAKEIALERAALAGYRLAAFLNTHFR